MPRQCSICIHPQKEQIEIAHNNDTSNRRISTQYRVTESALRRHWAHKRSASIPCAPPTDRGRIETRLPGQNIPTEIKPEIQQAFLDMYIAVANESGACREIGINRSTVRYWEEHDQTFSLRYQDAKEQVRDAFRGEIYRRGVLGYEEEVATPKGLVVKIKKFSDRELEFGAKAIMPEYRDKLDVTSDGNTIASYDALAATFFNHAKAQAIHEAISEPVDSGNGVDNSSGIGGYSE